MSRNGTTHHVPQNQTMPAPGLGSLNYDLYLKRLSEKHPNIPVIIEHLTEDDVPRAKTFLDGKFRANGL